jgi:hypothetical protein
MPPSWHGHIGSCGWHSVGASFYRYTGIELYLDFCSHIIGLEVASRPATR